MKRRITEDSLYALEIPSQPAISPDGASVVYVLRTADREADENRSALWLASASGGEPRRLTHGTVDSAPAWSPDGDRLAFLRATQDSPQVWILPLQGGEPRQVTSLPKGAGPPVWSPDGRMIAFSAPVEL